MSRHCQFCALKSNKLNFAPLNSSCANQCAPCQMVHFPILLGLLQIYSISGKENFGIIWNEEKKNKIWREKHLERDLTSCLCITFKTDQSGPLLPTVPLGNSLRFPVAAKGDTRCESALHRELGYTAVSRKKNSCLSQLAVWQKHRALQEKPSMLFFFNTKLPSTPDKCAVTAASTSPFLLFRLLL